MNIRYIGLMKLQVPINFISKLREKLPLSSQLISGHCPPILYPLKTPENQRYHMSIFSGGAK